MAAPYGLTLFSGGGAAGSSSLAVSDSQANRILVFNRSSGTDFTSGKGADYVIGQPTFSQFTLGSSNSQLNSPLGIAVDSSDVFTSAITGTVRLMVFNKPTASDPSATLTVPIQAPQGIIVSFLTGRSWITSTQSNGVVFHFRCLILCSSPTHRRNQSNLTAPWLWRWIPSTISSWRIQPIASRFYFGQLYYRSTANYNGRRRVIRWPHSGNAGRDRSRGLFYL